MAGVCGLTRFPAHLPIPQHKKMVYWPEPPQGLAFFCEIAPSSGGETPLADSRVIYHSLEKDVREDFEERGISCHRYLYGPRWILHDRLRHRPVPLHTSPEGGVRHGRSIGGGTLLSEKQLNAVHAAIDWATMRFRRQKGDLLLVDNFLVTHGRMPFRGERRILVAIH